MTRATSHALLLGLALVGCVDAEFELQDRVSRPRVLAIIADRPEVHPGDEVRLRALIAGADAGDVELRWSMCPGDTAFEAGGFGGGGAFGVSGAEQFGESIADPGCAQGALATTPLSTVGDEAVVPGDCVDATEPWRCTRGIAEVFSALGATGGVPAELVDTIVDQVGVVVTVNLEVFVDGERVETAFKRVNVTRRDALGTNPPAPRFAVGDVWMSPAPGGDPRECVPERGERPVVAGVAEVRLRPDPSDEDWRETFPVLAIDGSLIEGRENAYYSWFSTEGELDPPVSVAPIRDTVWISAEQPGVVPLWVVVRDGHLGQSACRFEVEVVDVVPTFTGIERL